MSNSFFSKDWLEDFVNRTDEIPLPERVEGELAGAREEYWEFMDELKSSATGTFALILQQDEDDASDRYAFFEVEEGSITDAYLGEAGDPVHEECIFTFGGTERAWKEALEGPRKIEQHMMYRNLMVREGDYHVFYRLWPLLQEIFQAGFRAPTTFSVNGT